VSLSELAFATAELLRRHGYIDRALFDRLQGEFSRRTEEIDRVAARFGFSNRVSGEVPGSQRATSPKPKLARQHSSNHMKISFFASNPLSTSRLSLDEEVRMIEARIRDAKHRDMVSFKTHWAVKPEDLQQVLLEDEPVVVHFSGHGKGAEGIVLHSAYAGMETSLSEETLADLFRVLKDNIRVVVLNACYAEVQAQAIVREIDVVVGMSKGIGDEAARVFAAAFYRGLAFGKSVQTAFDLGLNALRLGNLGQTEVPRLLVRPGETASEIVLVAPTGQAPAQPVPEPPRRRPEAPAKPSRQSKAGSAKLSPAFRKLMQAYQNGELIAFVGAGVSRAAGLTTWAGLVEQVIEHAQGYGVSESTLTEVEELTKRGKLIDALTQLEHALGKPTFVGVVKDLLDDKDREIPPLGQALAALAPKLRAVLTTNLDRLLERAFPPSWVEYHRPQANLGRERNLILKLHGTLYDANTWILTRDQYDRAMYADPRHQPIFRALMLGAPMLFVGFGLDDADLNAVLGEIRAMSEGDPPRHFALVPEPIRPGQRRAMAEAGVMLVGYDNSDGTHAGALQVLEALGGA